MRRRGRKFYPAPPPTPEGMVYARLNGQLVLVDAARFQRAVIANMEGHDDKPDWVRWRAYEIDKPK